LANHTPGLDRFTHMQWYLARARNTVHFAAFTPKKIQEDEFRQFVKTFTDRAPQLLMSENTEEDCHVSVDGATADAIGNYTEAQTLDIDLASYLQANSDGYTNTGKPASEAWCVSADNADARGNRSFLMMQSTHALMEGADLAKILQGKSTDRTARSTIEAGLGFWPRLGMNLTAPLLGLVHLIMSKFEKRTPQDFRFYSLSVKSADIRRLAREIGISKRALLFALILYPMVRRSYLPKPKRRQLFAYSTLSAKRIRLEDDAYMTLRMQLLPFKGPSGFRDYARALNKALGEQNENELFTQFLYNRVLAVQRAVHRVLPWLYQGSFFGYAPYDIVLSLLPPVRPAGPFSPLSNVPVIGGSFTGTVPNAIYIAGMEEITVNLWADQTLMEGLQAMKDQLADCGIGYTDWMVPLSTPAMPGKPPAVVE